MGKWLFILLLTISLCTDKVNAQDIHVKDSAVYCEDPKRSWIDPKIIPVNWLLIEGKEEYFIRFVSEKDSILKSIYGYIEDAKNQPVPNGILCFGFGSINKTTCPNLDSGNVPSRIKDKLAGFGIGYHQLRSVLEQGGKEKDLKLLLRLKNSGCAG
ncbi:hypothetical protein [Terasakiella sp. SH-1]|uniref:hypothetical protein n=1 Tax=Terasakiella sp. SH-1 TaxID=2560057 RepID=UPI0010746408|nr:hypothetical protein [Terasakiella sp. SH-1]